MAYEVGVTAPMPGGGAFLVGGRAAVSRLSNSVRLLLRQREMTLMFQFHGQGLRFKLRMSLVMLKLAVTVLLRPRMRHHHKEHVRPRYRRLHQLLAMRMLSQLAVTVLLRPRMRSHHMQHVRPSHRRNRLSTSPLSRLLKKCIPFVRH